MQRPPILGFLAFGCLAGFILTFSGPLRKGAPAAPAVCHEQTVISDAWTKARKLAGVKPAFAAPR